MPSIVLRAAISLSPGCKLYYDCPLAGESFEANAFFDRYRGKRAQFVRYSEKLVGPLDHRGRLPGRYVNPKGIVVRFEGEEDERELNAVHFVVVDDALARLVSEDEEQERLGDLPHPILFYPGDMVRLTKQLALFEDAHEVGSVFLGESFTRDGVPRYEVLETVAEMERRIARFREENKKRQGNSKLVLGGLGHSRQSQNVAGDDISLIVRGNVYFLYNDPDCLAFENDDEEARFWWKDGIAERVGGSRAKQEGTEAYIMHSTFGQPKLKYAWDIFLSGEADLIQVHDLKSRPDEPDTYNTRRLHDCFAQHRDRVRALTMRRWAGKVSEAA